MNEILVSVPCECGAVAVKAMPVGAARKFAHAVLAACDGMGSVVVGHGGQG